MNYLDTLFRAFLEYRKETKDNHVLKQQRNAIAKANEAEDKIEITQTKCIIEDDWIEAIEKGLVYVEKAIREERQFIRSNGEVVPIEKAKNIGKESVEHLARHSQFLTKEPIEGGDIIPDQIYTVERLTDFAVYENRFLYMLLCYLRDFISLRYNKILDYTHTYSGNMSMEKRIVSDKSKMNYTVTLQEERKDDEYLKAHNESKDIIKRIDLIYKIVMRFLSTPLMDEVSKAPMLRPPITKTNVLKMNNNFKNAVALYEFVTSYNKDGFTVEQKVKTISPFKEDLADELSESVIMASFLTYYHGLGIKEYLKRNYEEENRVRRDEEAKNKEALLKRLQRDVRENGGDPFEYLLELENRIRLLKDECEDFARLREEFVVVSSDNEDLKRTNAELAEKVDVLIRDYEDKISDLQQKHSEAMSDARIAFATQMEQLKRTHAEDMEREKALAKENLERAEVEHQRVVEDLNANMKTAVERYESQISTLNQTMEENRKSYDASVAQIRGECMAKVSDAEKVATEKTKAYDKLLEEHMLLKARYTAIRKEMGKITPNEFATKEAFDDIEHQYNVFKKFFKGEWKDMKKRIRQDVFQGFKQEIKDVIDGSDKQKAEEKPTQEIKEEVKEQIKEEIAVTVTSEQPSVQAKLSENANLEQVKEQTETVEIQNETETVDGNEEQ